MKKLLLLLFAAFSFCATVQAQSAKDKEIESLKKQIAEKQALIRLHKKGNLVPYVHFSKNSSSIENFNDDSLEMLAAYIKARPKALVEVRAYASADETNAKALCEDRANAVISKLISVYKVKPTQLRAVIVGNSVKLYGQTEYNRIVTFNDNNK